MPAEASYINVSDLKESLALQGETFADADLTQAGWSASKIVDEIAGRRFSVDADADQVRYYSPQSPHLLRIDDLVTLTSVKLDLDFDGTHEVTMAATDYYLSPLNAAADGYPYESIRVTPHGSYVFPNYVRGVEVTGKFGWPAVPKQIVLAAELLTVKLLRRKRDAPFGVIATGIDGVPIRIGREDHDVMALVRPFIRKTLVM